MKHLEIKVEGKNESDDSLVEDLVMNRTLVLLASCLQLMFNTITCWIFFVIAGRKFYIKEEKN